MSETIPPHYDPKEDISVLVRINTKLSTIEDQDLQKNKKGSKPVTG